MSIDAFDSIFDSSFSAAEPAATPEPVAAEPVAAEPAPEPTPTPTPEPDQPAAEPEPAAAEADPLEAIDDSTEPDKSDEKFHFFKKSKADRIVSEAKAWNEVGREIPGATVQTLKDAWANSVARENLLRDIGSGDAERTPAAVEFLMQHVGKDANRSAAFAGAVLQSLSPEALTQVQGAVLKPLVQSLYQQGQTAGNEHLFDLAQHIDHQFKVNDRYLTRDDFRQVSPEEQRVAELQQKLSRYEQQDATQATAAQKQYNTELQTSVQDAIATEVRSLVESFVDKADIESVVDDLVKAVNNAAESNPTWLNQYRSLLTAAQQSRAEGDRTRLMALIKVFATTHAKAGRMAAINRAKNARLGANAAAHQEKQQAAAHRDPVGAGVGTPANTLDERFKQATTYDEKWEVLGLKSN